MAVMRRALISVSDKIGIVEFAKGLQALGIEILSTGGTAALLKEHGVAVQEVADYTGFPEMLNGRVKTLHPKIHAGLLAVRDNPEHMQSLKQHDIGLIDMVVVNLYPFEKTIQKVNVSLHEAIENIDIGGPSMLRSAAKNHLSVAVICNPQRYQVILKELQENNNMLSDETMRQLGVEVFRITAHYDFAIHAYLRKHLLNDHEDVGSAFPYQMDLSFVKVQDVRYGENPHQKGALYRDAQRMAGLPLMQQLGGKELSFNNILDIHAAVALVKEFDNPAAVFIKHNNPCGAAQNKDILLAYKQAWQSDPMSAFGGIVGINREVDASLARLIAKSGFLECIVACGFSSEALSILAQKKNVRLLALPQLMEASKGVDMKRVWGGVLVQDVDNMVFGESYMKTVTKKKPTKAQTESLAFAWTVAKHVKSNAIVLAQGTKTVGIGAGQMSRVDSVFVAKHKSGILSRNSCLASDAFFPKTDAILAAARMGVKAIIQPGGSIADQEIIKMCDKHGMAMVFTGIRHFRH